MRVLITTEQYPPDTGGVGAVAFGLASGMAERGHAVSALATGRAHSDWRGEGDLRVRGAAWGTRTRLFKLLPITLAIRSALKSERPEWVLASAYRPTGLPAVFLARGSGVRSAIYVHGTQLLTEWKSAPRRRLLQYAFANADLLVANSQNTARLIEERLGPLATPVGVVHPGVDIERFRVTEEPPGAPVLLTLCHLSHRKGVDLVLESMARLRKNKFPELRLIVGGDGPAASDLKAKARSLGIDQAVEWQGRVARGDVPALMSRCTLFVMASRDVPDELESFGIVYLEAGAVGRAVVGTRVGGVAEAVVEGETGLLAHEESGGGGRWGAYPSSPRERAGAKRC